MTRNAVITFFIGLCGTLSDLRELGNRMN